MPTLSLFDWAALIAGATVLGIALILVPEAAWTAPVIISIALFALAVGFIFYVPSLIAARRSQGNVGQMASIGLLGALSAAMLPLTALGAALALFEFNKLALALDLFSVGCFVICLLILQAASKVLVNATATVNSAHRRWQGEAQILSGMATTDKDRELLEKLADSLRNAASDVAGGSPHDAEIDGHLAQMQDLVKAGGAQLAETVKQLELLLLKRDVFLRAERSK